MRLSELVKAMSILDRHLVNNRVVYFDPGQVLVPFCYIKNLDDETELRRLGWKVIEHPTLDKCWSYQEEKETLCNENR